MKTVITLDEAQRLKNAVRKRDSCHCVLCGRLTRVVHEIEPKSHGVKFSARIFKLENMCCLCQRCHERLHFSADGGARKTLTQQIKHVLQSRYHYVYQGESSMKSNAISKGLIRKGKDALHGARSGVFVKIEENSAVDLIPLCGVDGFISFEQHTFWNDEGNSPTFVCLHDESCPGCSLGNQPGTKVFIPVYDLTAKAAKIYSCSTKMAQTIGDVEAETGTIIGRVFRIKRKGAGIKTRYTLIPLNKKANVSKIEVPDVEKEIIVKTKDEILRTLQEAGFTDDDFEELGGEDEEETKPARKKVKPTK